MGLAQTLVNSSWSTTTGLPLPDKEWAASALRSDGSLISLGHTISSVGHADVLLTRYDPDGQVLWQQTYHHTGLSEEFGIDLALTAEDEILVCAASMSDSTSDADYLVLRFDVEGQFLWSYLYDGPAQGEDVPSSIVLDPDGFVYLTGSSEGNGTGQDIVTICLDSEGQFQWLDRYDRLGYEDIAAKLIYSLEGELLITGGSGESTADWDYVSLNYETDGTLSKTYVDPSPGIGLDKPADLVQDGSGNLYITGAASSSGSSYDMLTIKLDTAFQLVWSQTHGLSGVDDAGLSIDVDAQGNVYVAGYESDASGNQRFKLIKYDASGTLLWERSLPPSEPGQQGVAKRVMLDSDGEVIVLGERYGLVETEIVTMGLDAEGKTKWQQNYIHSSLPGEHPLTLALNAWGEVFVGGITIVVGQERYLNLKYERLDRDLSVVYGSSGNALQIKNELLIRFSPQLVDSGFVDAQHLTFASMDDIITDPNLINEMDDKLQAGGNLGDWIAFKVHPHLTSSDTHGISRSGETFRIPPLWATFVLRIQEAIPPTRSGQTELDWADSLNSISKEKIRFASPNWTASPTGNPNDPLWAEQRSLRGDDCVTGINFDDGHIFVGEAWNFMGTHPKGKASVRVGIMDSGIKANHPDLKGDGSYGGIEGSVVDPGFDCLNNPATTVNSAGAFNHDHGTKAAGIIAALRNNATGISGIAGGDIDSDSAEGVHVLPMIISDQFGKIPIDAACRAFSLAATGGPNTSPLFDIMNNSWTYSLETEWDATISYFELDPADVAALKECVRLAYKSGIIMINSRGNHDEAWGNQTLNDPDAPSYPATYRDDWGISVGGANEDGIREGYGGNLSDDFVSYYALDMDLLAPSKRTAPYPPFAGEFDLIRTLGTLPSFTYDYFGRTSASAAHAAGVVALLESYTNINLSQEDAEHLLEYGATDKIYFKLVPDSIQLAFPGYDDDSGWGILNALESIKLVERGPRAVLHFKSQPQASTAQLLNTGVDIELLDDYELPSSGTVIGKGVYNNVSVYKYSSTVSHQLNPSASLIVIDSVRPGYWPRNSASNLWHYPSGTGTIPIEPEDQISLTADINQATVEGYYFELSTGGQTYVIPEGANVSPQMTYSLLVEDPMGVDNDGVSEDLFSFQLYPNPTANQVYIQYELSRPELTEIYIVNLAGQKLISQAAESNTQGLHRQAIHLDVLPSGMYLVQLHIGNRQYHQKLIKQ